MALNSRQIDFITRLKKFATDMENLHSEAFNLGQAFDEEFDDAQDNSFLVSNTDLTTFYFFDSTDIKSAVNQSVDNFINFWTGSAVGTREYGKDLRRIK
jgi:hypothetical protein